MTQPNPHGACRHWRAGLACILGAASFGACDSGAGGQACTAIFAYVTATVVDESGQPVLVAGVRDSVLRTGAAFDVAQYGFLNAAGTAVVFSDGNIGAVRQSGDSVRATGTAAGKSFSATYRFGSDGCHITRIAGPDTVVAR